MDIIKEKLTATDRLQKKTIKKRALKRISQHQEGSQPKVNSLLMISTFPPTECGIATYSNDLLQNLKKTYKSSLTLKVCPIINDKLQPEENENFEYALNSASEASYKTLANRINTDTAIDSIMVQHEFGLFYECESAFLEFLSVIDKTKIICFHTVLPEPDSHKQYTVTSIDLYVDSIIVMTEKSKDILITYYGIEKDKISVINHGTHLIPHKNKTNLKKKYNLDSKFVLSTFGLIGPGKSIETTIEALPDVVNEHPDVVFLILGKTHPNLKRSEGESYRNSLISRVNRLKLNDHVIFVDEFLPIDTLLDFLQLTDIYLFTSNDPNQATSGTFSYAMSCGCAIISTPIPHAVEFLSNDKGLLFDFGNSAMLAEKIKILLKDDGYRRNLGLNALHAISATAWENSALSHGIILKKLSKKLKFEYRKPKLKLDHLFKMTSETGIIQFAKLNQPDFSSGYTLDDNARALIAICEAYNLSEDPYLLKYLKIYFCFIVKCQRFDGSFYNYIDKNEQITSQNDAVNLEDSNGRAIWALGHLIGLKEIFPLHVNYMFARAQDCIDDYLINASNVNSPRAIAFTIKGLCEANKTSKSSKYLDMISFLGNKLIPMYKHQSRSNWKWFEPYLTYGNSILPEAMLDVYAATGCKKAKAIAFISFNFLMEVYFKNNTFNVVSNKKWLMREDSIETIFKGGQQPIDVAYTILALKKFHKAFPFENYDQKMKFAFNWFLGNNYLNQTIYNPCTSGCFDGLEDANVNLNQGAESTISYLMARMAIMSNKNKKSRKKI